jgi:hypothetical protein
MHTLTGQQQASNNHKKYFWRGFRSSVVAEAHIITVAHSKASKVCARPRPPARWARDKPMVLSIPKIHLLSGA